MLEVKDLIKVYSTKGGAEVRALDGITISFEEKGMVFLLGRSGSGKSTLLNVCGGLDSPDSGEIIVKGKSSKDFSASDFDSYRNTYVGFIFQEYNILNEFTVEDNIALALELQGKPKDRAEIARILEQVDLTDFAKRKPNTLSGGQKQRVAIARALVKNPEIIMADEPTGALDSNTGKQVLDTLKKLSRDKLVIVVSHDREFAEEYGDRIIELMDGKVVSDVVKSSIAAKKDSDNVSVLEDNTLLIKSGADLTEKDIAKIKKIISSSKEDVLVSTNKNDITLYKKSAKINDDNSKECFVELTEQPDSKSEDDAKFIKSKLKFKHAFKIGASGIRTKPFRFILTLFLSTVAFIMFGLLSCLMYYDADKTLVQSLYEDGTDYYYLQKGYVLHVDSYDEERVNSYSYKEDTAMSDEDIKILTEKFGDNIIKVTKVFSVSLDNLYLDNDNKYYYTDKVYGFVENSSALDYIMGGAPQNDTEIAISEFLYDSIRKGTLSNPSGEGVITINDYNDIQLTLSNDSAIQSGAASSYSYKVSGVFKCEEVPSEFDSLKTTSDKKLADKFDALKEEKFFAYIAIDGASYDVFKSRYGSKYFSSADNISVMGCDLWIDLKDTYGNNSVGNVYDHSLMEYYYDWNGNRIKTDTLPENAVLLNSNLTRSMFTNIDEAVDNMTGTELYYRYHYENTSYENMTCYDVINKIGDGLTDETGAEELAMMIKAVTEFFDQYSPGFLDDYKNSEMEVGYAFDAQEFNGEILIAGFAFGDYTPSLLMSKKYLADYFEYSLINRGYSVTSCKYDMSKIQSGKYSCVFLPSGDSADGVKNILDFTKQEYDDDSAYLIKSALKDNIEGYGGMVGTLSDVFLWVGLVLAVFSMLLLFNFISASITAKKKEIGILRAVGARGSDVFKIFFIEAAIVVVVCVILSILITGIMSGYINNSISEGMGIEFQMFVFGIESVLTILAIAIVTAFVSTFVPVYVYAKKKPVESIRAL